MKCPNCSTESDGRYCPSCGVPLHGATCRVCGAALLGGAGYCTQCGESVQPRRTSALPWYIAGAAVVALIVVLIRPALSGPRAPAFQGGATAGAPAAGVAQQGAPPALTGTPREQADRLFNRIMQEREAGNLDQAAFFLPMAISAYQQAGPRFADGLATARQILDMAPDHLLGLAAAADAALESGDSAAGTAFWARYVEVFDVEKEKPLQEYLDHARILPEYLQTARQATSR